jgi:hypothetical protein
VSIAGPLHTDPSGIVGGALARQAAVRRQALARRPPRNYGPQMPLRVPRGEAQPRTASNYAEIDGEVFVHAAFMLLLLTFHCISK